MIRELVLALRACAVTFVLCAVAYPAVVWGLAQLLFPVSGGREPDLRPDGRTVIGSELIAQKFESDRYFHPRPSAVDLQGRRGRRLEPGDRTTPTCARRSPTESTALKATPEQPGSGRPGHGVGLGARSGHQPGGRRSYQAPRVAAAARLADREGPRLIDRADQSIGSDPGCAAARQCAAPEPGSRRQATRCSPLTGRARSMSRVGQPSPWRRRNSIDRLPSSS